MKFLLDMGWTKAIISKVITFVITKKAGIKAELGINDLEVTDDAEGITVHLDMNVRMTKQEVERLLKELM